MTEPEDDRRLMKEAAQLYREKRYYQAFERLEEIASRGHTHVNVHLGWMTLFGKGTKRDPEKAREWLTPPAEENAPLAQFYLARLCVMENKFDEAVDWYRRSAVQGFSPSLYQLGWMHAKGAGVEKDRSKAFAYYRQSADKGNIWALAKFAAYCLVGKEGIGGMFRGAKILITLPYVFVTLAAEDRYSEQLKR